MEGSTELIITYLLTWSVIGFALFCVYVVFVFRTGLVYTARKADGTLKKKVPLSGVLNMLAFLCGIVGLQVLANYTGLKRQGVTLTFWGLVLLNYAHYFILFILDTLIIDGLVLSCWRPGFLKLPDAMGCESMKKHMLVSLPVGLLAGGLLVLLSTGIAYLAFFAG